MKITTSRKSKNHRQARRLEAGRKAAIQQRGMRAASLDQPKSVPLIQAEEIYSRSNDESQVN